jgi:hypothetical protein
MPTVATASGPSLDTKNMSTMANMDSMIISSTIGTDSSNIALPRCPLVKSCSVPLIDSHMSRNSRFICFLLESFCEDMIVDEYKSLLMLFSFKVLVS